jgi:hypothetical protein
MKSKKQFVIFSSVVLMLLFCTGSGQAKSFPPLPEALAALNPDEQVDVEKKVLPWTLLNHDYYVFTPKEKSPATAFVFYPGGLVDPRAYAPPLHAIAAAGYLAILVSMPFDLAPFGPNRAQKIIRQYPGIKKWAIGGHSAGGSFACKYAKEHTGEIAGVVLWASWPSESFRLDDTELKAISIYGTKDGQPDEIRDGAKDLPADAIFVEIQGGNHTQFGYYDTAPDPVQPGDGIADITREEQQTIIIKSTIEFLEKL